MDNTSLYFVFFCLRLRSRTHPVERWFILQSRCLDVLMPNDDDNDAVVDFLVILITSGLDTGWTEKEVEVFRLALMKFGLGKWTDIVKAGCLPGKTVAQLNNQMQRMLGQQSTSEFTGLHIDPLHVFAENEKKPGRRKNGCLINMDGNMSQNQIRRKRAANEEKFGLDPAEIRSIVIPVLRHEDTSNVVNTLSMQHNASLRRARYDRLRQLQRQLASLTAALERVRAGESAEIPEDDPAATATTEEQRPEDDGGNVEMGTSATSTDDIPASTTKKKAAKPRAKTAKAAKPKAKARSKAKAPKTQEEKDLEFARLLQAEEDGGLDDAYGDAYDDDDFEWSTRSKRRRTTSRRRSRG